MSVELSVLVPCFNEEGNLPELVDRTERAFDRRRIAGEIVLVNDGSLDGTGAQIDALAAGHPRVVAVHHPTNRGIPAGWKSGLAHSQGRYVCTIDADLQYQPEAVALLYREIRFSGADLVQGWRSSLERQAYDIRYYMSRGLDHLLKLVFGMHEHDVKSGFVIYKREVFEDILAYARGYFYFQHLITVVAKAKGYSIRQVETLFLERRAGHSFISLFPVKMIVRTLVDIARAVGEFRLRETKDQSLSLALASRPAPPPPAEEPWRRRYRRLYRALTPVHQSRVSRNAWRYLDELVRTQWLPREEVEELQLRRLRRLVHHAYEHVGYYRELFQTAGLVPDDIRSLDDLRRLPVLGKQPLRENLTFDLVSDTHSTRRIEKILTSGASGEPLALFVDPFQLELRWAHAMRALAWTGHRFPDPQLRLARTADGRGSVRERLDGVLSRRQVHPVVPLEPATVERILDSVRRRRPALLEGDAEVLNLVATLLGARAGGSLGAGAILTWGQTLAPDVRAAIARVLGGAVFDQYGVREIGSIAQECEAHDGYHLNAESYLVEVIRDGRRAGEGEVGEVLVTDLNSRSVPLLRYRVGDLAVPSDRPCRCGRGLPRLERIFGRAQAAVRGSGDRWVPATFFADLFAQFEHAIARYQVVQETPGHLEVRIVRKSRFTSATEQELRRVVATVAGDDVVLALVFVDTIRSEEPPCISRVPLPMIPAGAIPPWEEIRVGAAR